MSVRTSVFVDRFVYENAALVFRDCGIRIRARDIPFDIGPEACGIIPPLPAEKIDVGIIPPAVVIGRDAPDDRATEFWRVKYGLYQGDQIVMAEPGG
ncbi:hypothetical protein D3C80_1944380 [compost metagenome]